ncbi:hypothetical protein D9M68_726720 [compost metagenome]
MSGWLRLLQLPLDSQKALWSRTATFSWYALAKRRPLPHCTSQAVKSASCCSLRSFLRMTCSSFVMPSSQLSAAAMPPLRTRSMKTWAMWSALKSYIATDSERVVPSRKGRSTGHPASGPTWHRKGCFTL